MNSVDNEIIFISLQLFSLKNYFLSVSFEGRSVASNFCHEIKDRYAMNPSVRCSNWLKDVFSQKSWVIQKFKES